jgi:hypothetical protein
MAKMVRIKGGAVHVVKTSAAPSFLDRFKASYAKIVVVLSSALVVANQATPLLDFVPPQYKSALSGALAAVAGVVALLKNEQGWFESL